MALPLQKSVLKKIQSYIQKKGSTWKHKVGKKKAVYSLISTGKNSAILKKAQDKRRKLLASSRMQNSVPGQTKKKEKKEIRFGQRPIRQLTISWPTDTMYRSIWIAKLINKLTKSGKKTQSEKTVLQCLTNLNQACRGNVLLVIHETMELLRPSLTIVVRRIGRRYYQVPVPLKIRRQHTMALNWLLNVVKDSPQKMAADILAEELINTYFFKRSESLRQKEQLYQTVIKNRAFNHYRWV